MSGYCKWLGDNFVTQPLPLIVTGSSGRLGRLMRVHEQAIEGVGISPVWAARNGRAGGRAWDMISGSVPDLPLCGFLLHLAAVLPSRPPGADLQNNVALAKAVLAADRAASFAHVFFLSTVAVYAPQDRAIAETTAPDPQADYGRSKLQAEQVLRAGLGERLTILRLGNLAGADALLGSTGKVVLDPVPGGGGPIRSYIGPSAFARALTRLMALRARGQVLPPVINLALPGAVDMADLLRAAGRDWRFGPPRPGVVARVEVDVSRLVKLVPLPPARAADIVADLDTLQGRWP